MSDGYYPERTVHDSPLEYPPELWLARGGILHHEKIDVFGHCTLSSGVLAPITYGNFYRTPQVGSETQLRIKAGGNAADTAAGAGARAVTLTGLNALGEVITETIETAGASASAPTSQSFLRLLEARVSASGTYATQTAGSHAANIVIENAAGGTNWATIAINGFPAGRAQIGIYTVPKGKTAYLSHIALQAESQKLTSFLLFKRENILETAAPYTPMVELQHFPEVTGGLQINIDTPIRFPELTDFGFMGLVDGQTANVSSAMELILVDNVT